MSFRPFRPHAGKVAHSLVIIFLYNKTHNARNTLTVKTTRYLPFETWHLTSDNTWYLSRLKRPVEDLPLPFTVRTTKIRQLETPFRIFIIRACSAIPRVIVFINIEKGQPWVRPIESIYKTHACKTRPMTGLLAGYYHFLILWSHSVLGGVLCIRTCRLT